MTRRWPNRRRFLLPLAFGLAAVAALAIDLPVARMFQEWNKQESIHGYLGYFDIFEPFGHGLLGVSLVLLVLHQLDPARRWAIPRVLACALTAGAVTDLLKMLVARTRPNDFAFDGPVWTTFGQWLPLLSAGSERQSFASGHTGTAAGAGGRDGLALPQRPHPLSHRGRAGGLSADYRRAHYPSDVLAGAAVGCLVAALFLEVGRLPGWFARWESRWRKK